MAETIENASIRKRSLWPMVTALGTVLALLLIAFMPTQDEGWEAMRARIAERQEETRSRKLPRTVLGGKPIPGNAWEEYDIIISDAMTWKEDPNGGISAQFAESRETSTARQIVMKMIADHGAMLDHLHRGARREDGQYPYRWELGPRMQLPSLLECRKVANLAGARARALLESDQAPDAANLLVDLSAFARDLSGNGPLISHLIGAAFYTMAFDGLRNVILSGKLSSEELKSLAEALEAVDHDMPDFGLMLVNESLSSGSAALEIGSPSMLTNEWMGLMAQGGWRYGLSSRQMAVDFFNIMDMSGARSRKLGEMSFNDAMKEADAIVTEMSASRNPVVRQFVSSLSRVVLTHREVVAKLRLLRAAAIWRTTGKMPKLADPFGGDLQMSEGDTKILMWSLGTDGANQNGVGSWSSSTTRVAEDIPLELAK